MFACNIAMLVKRAKTYHSRGDGPHQLIVRLKEQSEQN